MNELDNLREKMNRTVLKDLKFEEKHKRAVLKSVSRDGRKGIPLRMVNMAVSIALTLAVISGLGYIVGQNVGGMNESKLNNETVVGSNKDPNQIKTDLTEQNPVLANPEQHEEFDGNMTKEEVLLRLINTVDHFDTATGKFEYKQENSEVMQVEYKVSLMEPVGGYSLDDHGTTYYNGERMWELDQTRNYTTLPYSHNNGAPPLTLEEAFTKDNEGHHMTLYRDHPPLGLGSKSLFPYEIASNYTRDLAQWEIENQNEELLGHNVIVLKGNLNTVGAKSFRFWVEKATGILMKYETYDETGEVLEFVHPIELNINIPIDSQDFIPDLEGYQERSKAMETEQDPGDKEIINIAGAKGFDEEGSKKVQQVLEQIQENIPYLYEIKHKDFTLISASLEQYENYKQGALYYMHNDNFKEESTESKMLNIRFYHKDSYVRESGTGFTKQKGKPEAIFEMNDIYWEEYTLPTGNTHFIGEKGNYIYEVVSQDLAVSATKEYLESFVPTNEIETGLLFNTLAVPC
ncbi:hypothetical protein NC661_16860 [Aquibacillus koreensis]|uniref:MucB/RseB N-terminal domain-containing protein n=1 Tax=Aquibacillus koreensis TaxID=279446 RepID=A0A9X4AL40_9BACI|nr:sigma-E factor regulatory protein RseB domain-containing protein [Aquibacillus koreensis]MCT2536108.1 hypothetical protein [Aquibacillus koreensis]MDC3422033.1 hypothetical protein [Aquibacillus koreensis]